MSKRHIGVHEAHCDARWYQCPACGEKVHHRRRAQHYQTSCSKVVTKCEYAPYGCTATPLKGEYMDHLKEAAGAHLQMVISGGKGYENMVKLHQIKEKEHAEAMQQGLERVQNYNEVAARLKNDVAQAAEQHTGSARVVDKIMGDSAGRVEAASEALLQEIETLRADYQARCFRNYSEAQTLRSRVIQDTVPLDHLDEGCGAFDVAATHSIEEHKGAERDVRRRREEARAVMEPTLARLALMDLREDQLLQQLREKTSATHALLTEKALACWRHLHTTGVPGRLERIGHVKSRLDFRLERLEAGSYTTADEVLELSRELRVRERLPEVVELRRLYTEVADALEGAPPESAADILAPHIASEAPVFEITGGSGEGMRAGSGEPADEGAVLNAIQLLENARWSRRSAEDALLRVQEDLSAQEARASALEEQEHKLKDARNCLEQTDGRAETIEYLEEVLNLTRAYLARLKSETSQGGDTLQGLAQNLDREGREVEAIEAEVSALGDDIVATTDQPAVAALSRALAIDPKASAAELEEGGGDSWRADGGLPLAADMDADDFESEDRLYEELVESEYFNVPEMAAGLESCQEEVAFAEQRIADIEASLAFLAGRPEDSGAARAESEALVAKWRRRLGNALARREALLAKLPFRSRARSAVAAAATVAEAPLAGGARALPSAVVLPERGASPPPPSSPALLQEQKKHPIEEAPAGKPLAYPSGGPGPRRPESHYAPAHFSAGPRFGASRQQAGEGEWYQGQWLKGRVHGRGRYHWPDGTTYEGALSEGELSGSGEMAYANGDAYIGKWAASRRHGIGKLRTAGGDTYYGDWVKGKKSGQGVMHFATGDEYSGAWRGDEQNGFGKFVAWSGETTAGIWEGGELRELIQDPAEYEQRARLSWKGKARTRAWAKEAKLRKGAGGSTAVPALNPLDSLGLKMPNVPSLRKKFVMRR